MDEVLAKNWLRSELNVSRETLEKLESYVSMLLTEAQNQNLIARSTTEDVWSRHIIDSAQLFPISGPNHGKWLDLGSGPGLPGIVLALIAELEITLVEPRSRRVKFLEACVDRLGLGERVTIEGKRLERVAGRPSDVITARAFAPLPKLFRLAQRFAGPNTLWILPKGKSVEGDLAEAKASWQGQFETVQSMTDSQSFIVTARDVKPRRGR